MEMILRFFSKTAVFPLFILLFLGVSFIVFRSAHSQIIRYYSLVCICVWGFGLLYVTLLSRTPVFETRINLVPFQKESFAIFDVITNIIMFIPFSILLYGVLQRKISFMILIIAGIGLSMAIECLQFVMHRGICDVDDLILNSAGTIIGSLLTLCLMKKEYFV